MAINEETNQKEVAEFVSETFNSWKEQRSPKEQVWTDCVNNYLTYVDESKYENWPWRSKVCDTFSQEIGDIITSSLKNSLFPIGENIFEIEDANKEKDITNAIEMSNYYSKQLKKSRYVEKMRPFLKQLAVTGNSAAITPWVHKKRPRKTRRKGKIITLNETIYDNFTFDTIDMFDCVVDPHSPYDPVTSIFMYKRVVHLNTLKSAPEGTYSNLNELSEDGVSQDQSSTHKAQRAAIFGLDLDEAVSSSKKGVELIFAFGDFNIGGKEYLDYMIVVGNDNVLLRFEENPYWGGKPVTFATYDDLWFSGYGKGPLEPVLGVQELINTFSNQKADILNMIIMGTFAYVEDGIIDPDDLFMQPGGGIPVGDIDNIRPLHPNTNVALTFQEISEYREGGDRSTGLSDFERGQFPGGRKSAREASIIKAGSSNRFNDIIKHVGGRAVSHTLRFFLESLKQFKYGSGEIDDKILEGEYDLKYLGAETSINNAELLERLQVLNQMMQQNKEITLAIDEAEFAKEAVKAIGIKNPKLARTREQIEIKREQDQALAEAQIAASQQEQALLKARGGAEGAEQV